tara:strand:+ start:1620 stop:1859 length:240 start_codon:yes stop_codon:yes gene_type:complete
MPKRGKHPNVKKYANSTGKEYYYHRPSGTRLRGEYESAEWLQHYFTLEKKRVTVPGDVKSESVAHLIADYQTRNLKWIN